MLIIDGHNLTFLDEQARDSIKTGDPEGSRIRILDLVETWCRLAAQTATVVFDGTGGGRAPSSDRPGVECIFSGADRTADLCILDMLDESTGRREVCVVTNDNQLLAAARRRGARTLTADDFVARLEDLRRKKRRPATEPLAKRVGAPPSEVARLLKVFKEDDVARIEREEAGCARHTQRKPRP